MAYPLLHGMVCVPGGIGGRRSHSAGHEIFTGVGGLGVQGAKTFLHAGGVGLGVFGKAGLVGQELAECDLLPTFIDRFGKLGIKLGDGAVPVELALFDEVGAEQGGHGLGATREVETVCKVEAAAFAEFLHAGDALAGGFAVFKDQGRKTRELVLVLNSAHQGGLFLLREGGDAQENEQES